MIIIGRTYFIILITDPHGHQSLFFITYTSGTKSLISFQQHQHLENGNTIRILEVSILQAESHWK